MIKDKPNNSANRVAKLLLVVTGLLFLLELLVKQQILKTGSGLVPILQIAVLLAPAIFYAFIFKFPTKELFCLKQPPKYAYFFTLSASVPLSLFCLLILVLQGLIPGWAPVDIAVSNENNIILFLTVVIFPPFCEELLFRGVMLSEIKKYHNGIAMIITSLAFAFLHATSYNFIAPFVAGLFYAWLVLKYRSIYLAILAHFIYNLIVYFTTVYRNSLINILSNGVFGYVFIIVIFLIFIYLTITFFEKMIVNEKKIKKKTDDYIPLKRESAPGDLGNSPFLVLFFIVWIVRFILVLIF